MAFHNLSKDKVLADLETDKVTGLSGEEAAKRLEKYGENKLREKKKKTNLQRFFEQFKDVMILILIAAAIVSTVITIINVVKAEPGHKEYSEFFEPALILIIVIINAVMGVVQESKAEKALEALQGLSAPHARVLRDGVQTVINAKDLVPGDVIFLEAGDFIPADARLLESASLKSEESALTGESVPSEKDSAAEVKEDAPLGDRTNMVFPDVR